MTDGIIAIVPAKGHEGLIAEIEGERPALLYGTSAGWFRPSQLNEYRIPDGRKALVLHAPDGPKLGMVRLMEALGVNHVSTHLTPLGYGEASNDDGCDWYDVRVPPWEGCGRHCEPNRGYVLAHLAVQRNHGTEVLVLPVTP